jgi:hypothetical protein
MAETRHHLAQINIARLKAPLDDPSMADFVANLGPINALADASPGFVWRFHDEGGNATALRPYDDQQIIINFSVWEDLASLYDFVYQSAHANVMRRRSEWFERLTEMSIALWWVPAGHRPSIEEAMVRLEHLRRHGPSPHAFTFTQTYPPQETTSSQAQGPRPMAPGRTQNSITPGR